MNSSKEIIRKDGFGKMLKQNKAFFLMLMPGAILFFCFSYIPMAGTLIAFKRMKFYSNNIIINFIQSPSVGFKNFEFFLKSPDAARVTFHTVGYNLIFITLGLIFSVTLAIALNELTNSKLKKLFQTTFILPHFLSWVVVGYIVYAFLSPRTGVINRVFLESMGIDGPNWYAETAPWPYIFIFLSLWKTTGYTCVVYLAALSGIDQEYYEAASIDGASKLQQIRHILLPHLVPLMTILTILAVGRIFSGDFGLFFLTTAALGAGILKPVGDVLDTFVYSMLFNNHDLGMSAAASLYQSAVGFVLVLGSNLLVSKINNENTLF
jgi:putative aldouronate transport system permease protein